MQNGPRCDGPSLLRRSHWRCAGPLIFSTRHDVGQEAAYLDAFSRYEVETAWRGIFRAPVCQTIPVGAPEVKNAEHSCEVLV